MLRKTGHSRHRVTDASRVRVGAAMSPRVASSPATSDAPKTRRLPAPIPALALAPDEAAIALSVSRDFLDEHVADELRWIRRGRRKLVAVSELEQWLDRNGTRTLEVDR